VREVLFDVTIFALAGFAAFAQPAAKSLEFDAASVRVNMAGPNGRGRAKISDTPGRLTILNAPLRSIITWAYHVQFAQVSGPASLDAEYYDIIASSASAATQDQLRLMLQKLLMDRFKLALQRKTQVAAAYVLIPGKGRSRLHVSTDNGESGIDAGGAALINVKRVTVEKFAQLLSGPLKSPVVDMTGLKGLYDFKLDIVPYIERGDSAGVDDRKLDIPDILSQAVQDQLGLKLQLRRVSIMMLVIGHVERPSEN
jgi:uncharacterized protein (TIGR03435 family)